ncbi:hypothetical protein JOF56_007759 [Kibdelosporangium banguiense]|uniref:ATP-grasp domain-containing protein n=1 Tax=Kibdelosporangium banguiense TaxID=1365924 RepID=A0ABS4TSI7_9PSEU|nr:ATP-grasp domain-containing protein [Kibdelosporangium banguiense]MBP2327374.1 hypothetical protein [Kibdelosporangium banguiense]
MTSQYLRAIKLALTGDPATPLVFLCNFEAETQWAANYAGLPGPSFSGSAGLVRRMEELGLLLAGPDDYLVLKQPLDPGYADYARKLGFALPTILLPENAEDNRSTTEDVLDSPALLDRLTRIGAAGGRLLPMGTSTLEQKIAQTCGLRLAVPDADTFERVNSKIYSRRITEEAGLRTVPGRSCETVEDLVAAIRHHEPAIRRGRGAVVKAAFGVSGKGLLVLDSPAKMDGLVRMAERRAARSGDSRMHVVVESWLPKKYDLNYQFTIGRDGRVTFDFVKQALTQSGVHKGHLMPADLSAEHVTELEHASAVIGARLFLDGFVGVVGVDAIVTENKTLYPVLEINARLNMSTYQGGVSELCQPAGHVALARHYCVGPLSFAEVHRRLRPVLATTPDSNLVITCFGTVRHGRLYVMLTAPDRSRLAAFDAAAETALRNNE